LGGSTSSTKQEGQKEAFSRAPAFESAQHAAAAAAEGEERQVTTPRSGGLADENDL
jgi:hypothetical protein